MSVRQETYRFLRGTVPPNAETDTDRYGLQADGASAPIKVENHSPRKTIVVRGSFVATVLIQGSLEQTKNGATPTIWQQAASPVTAGAVIEIDSAWAWLRVSISGFSSGAVFVDVGMYSGSE